MEAGAGCEDLPTIRQKGQGCLWGATGGMACESLEDLASWGSQVFIPP